MPFDGCTNSRRLGDTAIPVVGNINPFSAQPRGMWRRTYQRLLQANAELMQEAGTEFERVCIAFLSASAGGDFAEAPHPSVRRRFGLLVRGLHA
jgi:hypothetical protein